jgi:hypothetical protein
MAPRSIWNGTIAFGLVNVPVKVYSATESKSIHFHQVHLSDGARIEHRRVCPKEDKEVLNDEIVKGYELSDGSFVELTKDEIAAVVLPGPQEIAGAEQLSRVAALDPGAPEHQAVDHQQPVAAADVLDLDRLAPRSGIELDRGRAGGVARLRALVERDDLGQGAVDVQHTDRVAHSSGSSSTSPPAEAGGGGE